MRFAVGAAAFTAAPALAFQPDPPLCRDAPPPTATDHGSGIVEVDWPYTVCLEHAQRARRMARLAGQLDLPDRPQVTQFLLDRRLLPPVFRGDVPLLRIVFPERSFFDTARSAIRPEALGALQLIAETLRREVPDVAVFVAGHTDDRGGEDYNHNLSVDRANAVAAHLSRLGVGGVALWRVGFGEAVPLMPNDSPENMAVNRRVEFIIGARAEAVATWLAREQPNLCSERGDTGRCLRQVRRRHVFEAFPETDRLGTIDPPRRVQVPLAATRGARVPAPARQARTISGLGDQGARIGAAPRTRIVIDLQVRRHRIETLDPL